MHGINVNKGVLEVIRTGTDMEKARREFRRLRRRIERAVIGQRMDAQRIDVAILIGSDLGMNMIVTTEAGAAQILRAVLDPFYGLTGGNRGHDRADIARIDGNLIAKAATDIGRDNANAMFRQARDDGKKRAMRVRRLRGEPDGKLAGSLMEIGDAAAGFNWRGMDTWDIHILADHDAISGSFGKRLLGGFFVARLPVINLVGRLLVLFIRAQQRSRRI